MSKFTGSSVPETLDAFNSRVRKMSKSENAMHRAMTDIANSPLGKQRSPPPKPGHAPPMPVEWSRADMTIILEKWSAALRKEKPYYLFNATDAVNALAVQNITESSVSKAQWDEWGKAIETTVENQLLSLDVADNVSIGDNGSNASSTPASPSRVAAPSTNVSHTRPPTGDGIATDASHDKENGKMNSKPLAQRELLGDGDSLPQRGLARVFASQEDNRVEPVPLDRIPSDPTRSEQESPKPVSSSSTRQSVEDKRTPNAASKGSHTPHDLRSETDDKTPKRLSTSQDSTHDRSTPLQSSSQAIADPLSTSKDRKKTKKKTTTEPFDDIPSPSRPADRPDSHLSPPKKGITVTQTKDWGIKSMSAHATSNAQAQQPREDVTPSGKNGFIWIVAIALPLFIIFAMTKWIMPTRINHSSLKVDLAQPSMELHPTPTASLLQNEQLLPVVKPGHEVVEVDTSGLSEQLAVVKETLFSKEEMEDEEPSPRSSKQLKHKHTTKDHALAHASPNWKRPFQNLFRGIKQGLDNLVHKIFPWTNRQAKGRNSL